MPSMLLLSLFAALVAGAAPPSCVSDTDEAALGVNLLQMRFSTVASLQEAAAEKGPGAIGAVDKAQKRGLEMLATDASLQLWGPQGATKPVIVPVALALSLVLCYFWFGQQPSTMDIVAFMSGYWLLMLILYGMFGDVEGGNMPMNVAFPWHPVLMTAAFPLCMVLARWLYVSDKNPEAGSSDAHDEGQEARLDLTRRLHRALNMVAAALMIAGYVAIFEAHWPDKKFFGYYFHDKVWADWQRVVHIYCGYTTILLVLVQISVGVLKYQSVQVGEKAYRWHGTMGKATILLAGITVLFAIWAWSWPAGMKMMLALLTISASALGGLWPRPTTA